MSFDLRQLGWGPKVFGRGSRPPMPTRLDTSDCLVLSSDRIPLDETYTQVDLSLLQRHDINAVDVCHFA